MKRSSFCFGVIAALAAQSVSAILPTCTWTGGGANGNWSTAANWNNCGGLHAVPVDGDKLVFPDGVPRTTNNNDLVKLMAAQLQINGVNYNITGNAIGLSGGISASVPLGTHGDVDPVFGPNIVLETNAQTFQCIGLRDLRLGGTVNLHDFALTVDGTCSITIAGNITGAGSIAKNGAGSLFLQGQASTYTGAMTINNGIVVAESDTALGAVGVGNETTVNDGGSLKLSGAAIDEDLNVSGAGFNSAGALVSTGADNILNGDITFLAFTTITTPPAANILTLTGSMVGGFQVQKNGAGTVQIDGVSDGQWFASAGTVEVNGSVAGAVAQSGAILAGSGISELTISDELGGTIAPGPSRGTRAGTFTGSNDMFWKAGGIMAFGLGATPAASDNIVLSDSLIKILTGAFTFAFTDASTPPTPGVTYTLISFANQNGFVVGDFDSTYTGTGPGSSMTGDFNLTPTELQFTPTTVVSDLVFRADNE